MKKLYFECNMGAAGDMLMASLYDAIEDKGSALERLNSLGVPNTSVTFKEKSMCGISGIHSRVLIGGEEEHQDDTAHHRQHNHNRTLADVLDIINSLNAPERVLEDAKSIYTIVAKAESKAHNADVAEVHFHELGMLDAIFDIVACSYLIYLINPDRIIASSINVGNGTVKCAHGILPVPAPATANILMGVPYYKSDINCELCTPTGAAIIKYFTDEYTNEPDLSSCSSIGIGVGTKELERANIVRCFVSNTSDNMIAELSCNLDDMTGEELAYAQEKIMKEGALDCFITPIIMKKGRPANMLTVLCNTQSVDHFAQLIFKHTTSLGIRRYLPSRYTLDRELVEMNTPYGNVTIKKSSGYNSSISKIEFEDLRKIAEENDISIRQARELLTK